MSWMIFLLVNAGRKSLPIFLLSSLRSYRTASADLWSLNGKTILMGWSSGNWCCGSAWSCERTKRLIVDSKSHSAIGKHLQEEPTNLQDQFYSPEEMPHKVWLFNLRDADHQEHKTKTYHAIGFCSRQTFYITFEYLNTFFNSLHIFTLLVLCIQSILSCNSKSIMMTWSHRNVVLFILYRSCLS